MESWRLLLRTALIVLHILQCTAFFVSFPSLSQCEPATITWNGTDADHPFEFFIAPLNSTGPILIKINAWDPTSSTGSYTLDGLKLRAGTQYVAAMMDDRDVDFGVVSAAVQSVAPSANFSCLNYGTVERPKVFSFATWPSQCQRWVINWDPSFTEPTVRVRGFVPGGTTFTLTQPPAGQSFQEWRVNAVKGTQFVLLYSTGGPLGKDTLVETSELITVQGNESSPTSCFLTENPTVTSSGPTNAVTDPVNSQGSVSQTGPIAGGIIGGIAGLLLIVGLVVLVWRRCVKHPTISPDGQVVSINGSPHIQLQSHSPSDGRNFVEEPVSQAQ